MTLQLIEMEEAKDAMKDLVVAMMVEEEVVEVAMIYLDFRKQYLGFLVKTTQSILKSLNLTLSVTEG